MKKYFFLLFFIVAMLSQIKAQQRFKAGLKVGANTSQVAGDTYSGFNKIGIVGGATVTGKINEKWSTQLEIIYSQKGSRHNANPDKGDYSYYFLQLDYIEVPILFQFQFQFHQKKIVFELGPGFSYLLNEKEYNDMQDLTGIFPFNKKEITYNLGITYIPYKNWGVSCRYNNSLTSIRDFSSGAKRWNNPGERNNVLAFSLIYIFGHGE